MLNYWKSGRLKQNFERWGLKDKNNNNNIYININVNINVIYSYYTTNNGKIINNYASKDTINMNE